MDLAPLNVAITATELQQWIAARREHRLSPLQKAELEEFFSKHPELAKLDVTDTVLAVGLKELLKTRFGGMSADERLAVRNWLAARYVADEMGMQENEVYEAWILDDPGVNDDVEAERLLRQGFKDLAADGGNPNDPPPED